MSLPLTDLVARTNAQIARNESRVQDFINLPSETTLVRFKDFGLRADIRGDFDDSCYVSMTPDAAAQLDNRQLQLIIRKRPV